MTWVSTQATTASRLSRPSSGSSGATAPSAASRPPIQSRYCGLSVLFGTISRQAAARASIPTSGSPAGRSGPVARHPRHHSQPSSASAATVATVDRALSAATPGPSSWKAKNRVYGVDQVCGLTVRPHSSGTAQIVSICSPRSPCQLSGDSSRVVPPPATVAATATAPRPAKPATTRRGRSRASSSAGQQRGRPQLHRRTGGGEQAGPQRPAGGQREQRGAGQRGGDQVEPGEGERAEAGHEQQPDPDPRRGPPAARPPQRGREDRVDGDHQQHERDQVRRGAAQRRPPGRHEDGQRRRRVLAQHLGDRRRAEQCLQLPAVVAHVAEDEILGDQDQHREHPGGEPPPDDPAARERGRTGRFGRGGLHARRGVHVHHPAGRAGPPRRRAGYGVAEPQPASAIPRSASQSTGSCFSPFWSPIRTSKCRW